MIIPPPPLPLLLFAVFDLRFIPADGENAAAEAAVAWAAAEAAAAAATAGLTFLSSAGAGGNKPKIAPHTAPATFLLARSALGFFNGSFVECKVS